MRNLQKLLSDYIALRRTLGSKMTKPADTLRGFIPFFAAQKAPYLTTKIALQWARLPKDANPAWWTERLGMLRGFASYWKTIDPRIEVPPVHILLPYYKRPLPHIYTDEQLSRIMLAARKIPSKDAITYWTLYGLMAATGIRVGEALALNNEDIGLKQGVITIRGGKHGNSRILPVHDTTRQNLQHYTRQRHRRFHRQKTGPFFVILDGRRPSHYMAWNTFKTVKIVAGIPPSSRPGYPRLHDLRHTFAVKALMQFYQAGGNVDLKIHALSTYLGHRGMSCTYWYLTAVPELMSTALARMEENMGGVL